MTKGLSRNLEYLDTDSRPLQKAHCDYFESLIRYLHEEEKAGNILLVYRGEEQKNIDRRLTPTGGTVNRTEVYQRTFYVGDKARHFSMDEFSNDRNFLTGINDCSDTTLSYIFERIANALSAKNLARRVRSNISKKFKDFFTNPNNSAAFIARINSTPNQELKLKIRDYYLYLLHTAGSLGVRRETMFVSTSVSYEIARGFSTAGKKNKPSRVVVHYFIPQPFHIHAIAPWVAEHHHRIAYEAALPTYKATGLFPHQKEVSVKGALFPHFILGIELVDEGKFIANTHCFNDDNQDFERISQFGFAIDQSNFENEIFDTSYIKWVQTDLNDNFDSHNV